MQTGCADVGCSRGSSVLAGNVKVFTVYIKLSWHYLGLAPTSYGMVLH